MEPILSGHAARTAWRVLWVTLWLNGLFHQSALAQVGTAITPTTGAGNLGTTVTQAGNTYHITGGTRPGSGPNLFHSFSDFGVPTNNIANFVNETGLSTTNILSRVTGGNPSNILGSIQTTGFGNANLFLMNPAGIVFGPNASLNVGGSVSFTTADYLRLADGARFNALPGPQDAAISSAPVAAFGFLGSNPAAITVQGGQLSVTPGQNISLIGGDITVQGVAAEEGAVQLPQLSAAGGQIALASVASPGEVLGRTLDYSANIDGEPLGALGTIQISQKAVIDSSGYDGGTILVRGGRFVVDDSTISANVTGPPSGQRSQTGTGIDIQMADDVVIRNLAVLETNVTNQASPGIRSGGVRIRADHIDIVGVPDFDSDTFTFLFSGIRSDVAPMSAGSRSGDIKLEANSINIDQGALFSRTGSQGSAGDIVLEATRNIELINGVHIQSISGSDIPEDPPASGNAGNVELTSRHGNISMLGVEDGPTFSIGDVTTETRGNSSGNTGTITVSALNGDVFQNISDVFTQTRGTGGAGRLDIAARNLTLSNAFISDDNLGITRPGGITVNLSNDLTMTGLSGLLTATRSRFGAPAADLDITARNILVTQGSKLSSETNFSGTGGLLTINADTIRVTDGGRISSGSIRLVRPGPEGTTVLGPIPSGPGGDISILTDAGPIGSVVVDGPGSGIFTNAEGTGAGGNLNLAAQSVTIQNGGTISASTKGIEASATGGNIAISSVKSTNLNGGSITASSSGAGDAGNIRINAGSQFLSNNGSVTTRSSQLNGGNITVEATDAIRLVNSLINTSVEGGPATVGGNINIDPAIMTLQNSQILARATQGSGGNINITAGTFLADQTSLVDARSQWGLSGTVNIQSPVSSLSGTLAALPQHPLQVQNLLSQRCAAQASGRLSSLVVAGRERLPVEPGGWMMSPMTWMADGGVSPPAQPATSQSTDGSHETLVHAAPLSAQPGPLPRHDMSSWATGCGS